MKRFHERLRDARKAAGFSSQAKFSDRIGMIRTNYLLYETGEKLPDPESTLPKIAEGLGLPLEQLMAWRAIDEYGFHAIGLAARELPFSEIIDIYKALSLENRSDLLGENIEDLEKSLKSINNKKEKKK